jgi:hypothetical protein
VHKDIRGKIKGDADKIVRDQKRKVITDLKDAAKSAKAKSKEEIRSAKDEAKGEMLRASVVAAQGGVPGGSSGAAPGRVHQPFEVLSPAECPASSEMRTFADADAFAAATDHDPKLPCCIQSVLALQTCLEADAATKGSVDRFGECFGNTSIAVRTGRAQAPAKANPTSDKLANILMQFAPSSKIVSHIPSVDVFSVAGYVVGMKSSRYDYLGIGNIRYTYSGSRTIFCIGAEELINALQCKNITDLWAALRQIGTEVF